MKLIGIGDRILGEKIERIQKIGNEYFILTSKNKYTQKEIEDYVDNQRTINTNSEESKRVSVRKS